MNQFYGNKKKGFNASETHFSASKDPVVEDGHHDFFDVKKKKKHDAGRAKNRFAGLLEKADKKDDSGSEAEEASKNDEK